MRSVKIYAYLLGKTFYREQCLKARTATTELYSLGVVGFDLWPRSERHFIIAGALGQWIIFWAFSNCVNYGASIGQFYNVTSQTDKVTEIVTLYRYKIQCNKVKSQAILTK